MKNRICKFSTSVISLLLGLSFSWASAAGTSNRLNLVFIIADDLGWADLGCYGSTFYETPHLDRLAAAGMRFTDAYAAASVCSPTRASILTGKAPARLQITDWLPGRPDRPDQKLLRPVLRQSLPPEEVTLAEALKEAGYRTAFVGKWHLGAATNSFPAQHGFDLNIGGSGLGHPPSYFSPYGLPGLADGPKGEFLNDRLTDEAIRFVEQAAQGNAPFLLYLSHYAVHTPLQAKAETLAKYRRKAEVLGDSGPAFETDRGRPVRAVQNLPVYGAMMENLDESVGHLLSALRRLGLETNTIIVFTSDNGGLSTAEGSPTSNKPLRMGKGWGHEGGVRVPLLISWPGGTAPGSVCRHPVISTDFYPTFLDMLRLPARPRQHLDGASFVAALRGGTPAPTPLFWHYPHYSNQGGAPHGAIRLGRWKLIENFEDQSLELYDLETDPGESRNQAESNPGQAEELRCKLQEWRKVVGAALPKPNPDYSPPR